MKTNWKRDKKEIVGEYRKVALALITALILAALGCGSFNLSTRQHYASGQLLLMAGGAFIWYIAFKLIYSSFTQTQKRIKELTFENDKLEKRHKYEMEHPEEVEAERKEKERFAKVTKLKKFFDKAKSVGVLSDDETWSDSAVFLQKLNLVGKDFGISITSKEDFDQIKSEVGEYTALLFRQKVAEQKRKNEDRVQYCLAHPQEIIAKYSAASEAESKYLSFSGREKRKVLLVEKLADLRKKESEIATLNKILLDSSKVSEKSGSDLLAGALYGIGGIGGAVTGTETLVKGRMQELAAKAYNNELEKSWGSTDLGGSMNNVISICRAQITLLEGELNELPMKYIKENYDPFEHLRFDASCDIKDCFAAEFDVDVTCEDFKFDDDLPPVIDGHLTVQILDGDTVVGQKRVSLPVFGVAPGKKETLSGTILLAAKCNWEEKGLTVKVVNDNVWAMER